MRPLKNRAFNERETEREGMILTMSVTRLASAFHFKALYVRHFPFIYRISDIKSFYKNSLNENQRHLQRAPFLLVKDKNKSLFYNILLRTEGKEL